TSVKPPCTELPCAGVRVACTVVGAGSGASAVAGLLGGASTDAGASAVVSAGAGAGSSLVPQAVQTTTGISSASASIFILGPSCEAGLDHRISVHDPASRRSRCRRRSGVVGFLPQPAALTRYQQLPCAGSSRYRVCVGAGAAGAGSGQLPSYGGQFGTARSAGG